MFSFRYSPKVFPDTTSIIAAITSWLRLYKNLVPGLNLRGVSTKESTSSHVVAFIPFSFNTLKIPARPRS